MADFLVVAAAARADFFCPGDRGGLGYAYVSSLDHARPRCPLEAMDSAAWLAGAFYCAE
jgi:hypothetical protein